MSDLKIGDVLYRFDGNIRVYADKKLGGGPIYSKHFEPLEIIGETRRSWLLAQGWKCDKRTLQSAESMQFGGRGFFTAEGMADDIWQHEHRHKITEAVRRLDVPTLRKVAEMIGYDAKQ